jgi:hypothetical protein
VKARNVRAADVLPITTRPVGVTPLDALSNRSSAASSRQNRALPRSDGIEVHEDELGTVLAQQLFKMRCECGRSWFELELPKLAKCPACSRLNLVVAT